MRSRRLLSVLARPRRRLAAIFLALLSFASLGVAGYVAAVTGPQAAPARTLPPLDGTPAASEDPSSFERGLRVTPEGRETAARKTWT